MRGGCAPRRRTAAASARQWPAAALGPTPHDWGRPRARAGPPSAPAAAAGEAPLPPLWSRLTCGRAAPTCLAGRAARPPAQQQPRLAWRLPTFGPRGSTPPRCPACAGPMSGARADTAARAARRAAPPWGRRARRPPTPPAPRGGGGRSGGGAPQRRPSAAGGRARARPPPPTARRGRNAARGALRGGAPPRRRRPCRRGGAGGGVVGRAGARRTGSRVGAGAAPRDGGAPRAPRTRRRS